MRVKHLEETCDEAQDAVLEEVLRLLSVRPVTRGLAALAACADNWTRACAARDRLIEAEDTLRFDPLAEEEAEVERLDAEREAIWASDCERMAQAREAEREANLAAMRSALRVGDRVTVRAPEGGTYEDVIRDLFEQEIVLEPHARNERQPAAVLTTRSWCLLSDVVAVRP
jgi:hypothetical protein